MSQNNIGSKRLVVGAHYGTKDWVAQRATAVAMAVYTLVVLFGFLTGKNFTYEGWAGMFAQEWFKILSFVVIVSLVYHTWVGMRNVWMDYVKPVGARLVMQFITVLWLLGCAGWAVQILWRV